MILACIQQKYQFLVCIKVKFYDILYDEMQ